MLNVLTRVLLKREWVKKIKTESDSCLGIGGEARRVLTQGVSKFIYLVMNITAWEYTRKHAGTCM